MREGGLLLWVLVATVCFFVMARIWVVAVEHFFPRAASPGGGAVLLALCTTAALFLAARRRMRRR